MTMSIALMLGVLSTVFITATPGIADTWEPITKLEFTSENGSHLLRLEPNGKPHYAPGHCRATLFKVNGNDRVELWSRYLINNIAPVRVFVSNSGNYVITMDEWGEVGEFPVVIYGGNGSLIRVHHIESLGLDQNLDHIKRTISSYWWNEDSISFFDSTEEMFCIRLHWQEWLVLDLRDGAKYVEKQRFFSNDQKRKHEEGLKALMEFRKTKLEEIAIKMLTSTNAHERRTGALVCGQEKFSKAVPALKSLLIDPACETTLDSEAGTRVFYVRRAAKVALERLGEQVGEVIDVVPDSQ